ncbi:class I SAM-dependent methyltransferase [Vibrio sp. S4M6]|uniref:class I SAM-dependent methyltransferase n=1 Tax=Vibrio sinus TaxID=2946865 RepID=UPI002029E948|nr:class I SAM-dependent methyltransferase [Vibrio sinus]MCL9782046.1 class I SAM-dependent methyltransferase [Vibrio sinus]
MKDILSHSLKNETGFAKELAKLEKRLENYPQHKNLLDQLCEFALGRFLIEHRGIDGYWTDVVVNHPERGRANAISAEGGPIHPLEQQLLDDAPTFLATQQRYQIFRQQLQKCLPNCKRLLSVPSGLMSELLSLDYQNQQDVELIAVDLDSNILGKIADNAKQYDFRGNVTLVEADAWSFELDEPVDVITSNGLNIYVEDDEKVESLYKQFYRVLKPQGRFIGSFLTPLDSWDMNKVDQDAMLLQKAIFADLLGVNWQQYRSEQLTREQLERAGFTNIEFIYDEAGIFPTFVATRG